MSFFDGILVALLIAGIFMGLKRGFILQAVHLIGFIVAYIVAFNFFDDFIPVVQSFIPYPFESEDAMATMFMGMINMETMYYSALSFAILFFGTKIALQIVGYSLHLFAQLPVLKTANRLLGAILGFVELFIILFVLIHVLLYIPWETGHAWLEGSLLASWMIEHTPYFSERLQELWQSKEEHFPFLEGNK
jgi:uncharacterized membrane protein required for colicin V production